MTMSFVNLLLLNQGGDDSLHRFNEGETPWISPLNNKFPPSKKLLVQLQSILFEFT